jgi:hypothetical protein
MNILRYFSYIFIICNFLILGQTYNGPSTGTVPSGVLVSTNEFSFESDANEFPGPETVRNRMEFYSEPTVIELDTEIFENYTYIEDTNTGSNFQDGIGASFVLNSFASLQMANSIPPDPHVAVGPNHVVTTVNSVFAIYDRDGNLIKSINADAWCGRVLANPGAFDPQIIYDHYEGRWFMLWDSQNSQSLTGHFIIAYSDDEDPIGDWYLYALSSTMNGSIPSSPLNWGDYPQVGYDDQGIYISSRQFYFSTSSYAYGKIRILNKSELYAANGGPLSFTDLWNIRLTNGQHTDDLHPTISYDPGNNTAYIIIVPNTGNFYSLYKITNPITNPVLTGINLGVPFFFLAPDAEQLGGGMPLDAGNFGSGMRDAPIIRDGKLYAVHHIRNSQFATSTSIKYFVIDINTNTVVDQIELGAEGFFYIYPSIIVDQEHNVAITYTRSGFTEYAGSYYSTRLSSDPQGLSPSKVMTEGKGNYVVTFGGDRNRWGDYLGAALDPVNQYNIWLYSEYAAATNSWGTWLTEIRMKPLAGIYPAISPNPTDFGDIEVNTNSDIHTVIIANYGEDDLIINEIDDAIGPFTVESTHNTPITLSTYDSLEIQIIFSPTVAGDYNEILSINSNHPSVTGLELIGHAYDMQVAYSEVLYASSGSNNNGDILTVNIETGVGTLLGNSLFTEVKRLAVNPANNIIYGIVNVPNGTEIVRVNAGQGDAYKLFTLDIPLITGIAFDNTGILYAAQQTGEIYTVDLNNGDYTFVTQAATAINAIAIHPTTNEFWSAYLKAIGAGKDSIFTIDLTSGVATPVGVTGFGVMTNDLTFDNNDKLFGIIGNATQSGELIEINTTDASGTLIGSIGFNHIVGLCYSLNGPVISVDEMKRFCPENFR